MFSNAILCPTARAALHVYVRVSDTHVRVHTFNVHAIGDVHHQLLSIRTASRMAVISK